MPTKTEILAPGQISQALNKRLKESGKLINKDTIAMFHERVEKTRRDFQVNAIMFGMVCLAKKASMKHGQWRPFLESLQNGRGSANLSERSTQVYMQLAKRFLSHLESGSFDKEMHDRRLGRMTVDDFAMVINGGCQGIDELIERMTQFVGERTLDRMLKDFRQAEKDALHEEDGEDTPDAQDEESGDTSPRLDREQLVFNFKEEIFTNLKKADELLHSDDPRVQLLKKEDLKDLWDYHRTRLHELESKFGKFE